VAANADSRIIFWSSGAERIFGWSPGEALGCSLTMLMPARFHDEHRTGIARVAAAGERHVIGGPPVELVGVRRDGSEFPIELSLGTWHDDTEGACFAAVVRDISERVYLQRVLTTQYAVAAAVAGSQGLEDGLLRALAAIGCGMDWQAGHLWVVGPDRRLRCRTTWHDDDALEPFVEASCLTTFGPGEGLPGRVWASGRPAWLADLRADANFPPCDVAESVGLRAAVGVPMIVGGEAQGVVEFFASELREEDASHVEAMAALGNQLGQFLLRREAEAELEERHRLQAQAAELNDEVVQGLALARYQLALGDMDSGQAAVDATLAAAKKIISDLLADSEIQPGGLRRTSAARLLIYAD